MLYLEAPDGKKVIILETENLEAIKAGRPAKTHDGSVLIAWTPDPEWLAQQILNSNGDAKLIAKAIDESVKRPQKSLRKYYQPKTHKFGGQVED